MSDTKDKARKITMLIDDTPEEVEVDETTTYGDLLDRYGLKRDEHTVAVNLDDNNTETVPDLTTLIPDNAVEIVPGFAHENG